MTKPAVMHVPVQGPLCQQQSHLEVHQRKAPRCKAFTATNVLAANDCRAVPRNPRPMARCRHAVHLASPDGERAMSAETGSAALRCRPNAAAACCHRFALADGPRARRRPSCSSFWLCAITT